MKSNIVLLALFSILFHSCVSSPNKVDVILIDNNQVLVLDEANITEKRKIAISELTDGYELIPFEDSDESFFKMQWMHFSEHYVCVRQANGPVKLFDNKGHFIHDVGSKGHGPGEYLSAYDVLVDEKSNSIYLASISDDGILKYNMQGVYIGKIQLESRINKGRLFQQSDSVLSLVHICFSESSDKFTAANITLSNPEKVNYIFNEALCVNSINDKKEYVGFNYENYSYRNTSQFAFCITSSDTLYHYDSQNKEIRAVFAVKPEHVSENPFILVNELPNHYLTFINNTVFLTEKKTGESYQVELINDYIGNTEIFPRIQDGYIFLSIQPELMKEELKKKVDSGGYPDGQKEQLNKLMTYFGSKNNDVLFRAKLIN